MNQSDLISIIIPTYNQANFLKNAIQSVLDQTYTNWELIIVDNYSTDSTEEIINQFKDSRIKKFQIKNNGIVAISRNVGIKMANGTWVAFLDSDDIWFPEKISYCLSKAENSYDFVFHKLAIIGKSFTFFKVEI